MYEKKTTVKDNQTEIRFKKNEENDLKHTKKKQNWKRLRHFLCVSLRCHGNEIQAAKYFKLFSVFSWILFYVSTFFLLFHFLAPSLPALPTFSLCCHDQTAMHCICSRVPRKKKKKKNCFWRLAALSCVSNPIILPVFDLILFLLTLNWTLQDVCVPPATPWVCEKQKQNKWRSEVGKGGGRKNDKKSKQTNRNIGK